MCFTVNKVTQHKQKLLAINETGALSLSLKLGNSRINNNK